MGGYHDNYFFGMEQFRFNNIRNSIRPLPTNKVPNWRFFLFYILFFNLFLKTFITKIHDPDGSGRTHGSKNSSDAGGMVVVTLTTMVGWNSDNNDGAGGGEMMMVMIIAIDWWWQYFKNQID